MFINFAALGKLLINSFLYFVTQMMSDKLLTQHGVHGFAI